MKKVYLLVHETYVYLDNDYDVSFKVFDDEQSAINYLKILRDECLADICERESTTIENLKQEVEDGSYYIYTFEDEPEYFKIEIEEYGYNCIYVEEQDIMTFNI